LSEDAYISVIIPVHNGEAHLDECLRALSCCGEGFEVIVIDDGSTDDSARIARRHSRVKLLQLAARGGPAAARNHGARQARSDVLLFIDADVRVRPDTVKRVTDHFRLKPKLAALFGSYDDSPASTRFVSQYKNLFHHFTHQQARPQAETFWAGCGAVRREVFMHLGGFDEQCYREPSIEDIELGYRLRRALYPVLLDKQLQVQHLKAWTLTSLLRADIFRRAVPWSRLMLERGALSRDLNLRVGERVSALATVSALALLALSLASTYLLAPASLLLMLVFILNRKMYYFFMRRMGPLSLPGVAALHLLYYCYSSAAFALCCMAHAFSGRKRAAAVERLEALH
jgi:glycosyltransferase involved in cell wall biosynthesis